MIILYDWTEGYREQWIRLWQTRDGIRAAIEEPSPSMDLTNPDNWIKVKCDD